MYNREEKLKKRLNVFLIEHLNVEPQDYYSNMDARSFLKLKSVLSDINNILTMKVTLAFVDLISVWLKLSDEERGTMHSQIQNTKPNANGYDIELSTEQKIIAEVKCNIPINNGDTYGSAQKDGIKKDIKALQEGKKKPNLNPKEYLKFLVLLDLPKIRMATQNLLKNMNDGDDIVFANEQTDFTKDEIYLVFVEF